MTPPDWLKGEARAEWDRIVPDLLQRRMIDESNLAVVVCYCQAWAGWRRAYAEMEQAGLTRNGYRGRPFEHPAVKTAHNFAILLLTFCRELGLTPKSRRHVTPLAPSLSIFGTAARKREQLPPRLEANE